MEGLKYKLKKNTVSFVVDCSVYPKEAINNTAFVFTDKMYVFLGKQTAAKMSVVLKAKEDISAKASARMVGEFHNELLNQTIRLQMVLHNKQLREFIIGSAMLGALGEKVALPDGGAGAQKANEDKFDALLEKELKMIEEESGSETDPLEISAPWKSKDPKNKKKK
jgi:His-Xaa-Ser system protein HxsD